MSKNSSFPIKNCPVFPPSFEKVSLKTKSLQFGVADTYSFFSACIFLWCCYIQKLLFNCTSNTLIGKCDLYVAFCGCKSVFYWKLLSIENRNYVHDTILGKKLRNTRYWNGRLQKVWQDKAKSRKKCVLLSWKFWNQNNKISIPTYLWLISSSIGE